MTRLLGLAMMLMFAIYGASFLGLFDLPYATQVLDKVQQLDVSTAAKAKTGSYSGSFTNHVSKQQEAHKAVQSASGSFTNRISKQGQKLSNNNVGAAVLRQNMLASGQQKLFFERG